MFLPSSPYVLPIADLCRTKVDIPSADRAIATGCNIELRSLGAALRTSLPRAFIQQRLRIRHGEITHGDKSVKKALEDVRNNLDAMKLLPVQLQASVRDNRAFAYRWLKFQTADMVVGID